VLYSPQVNAYIRDNYQQIKHYFDEGDLWSPERDAGFEELYRSLGTSLDHETVRYAVRSLLRRHLEDERGEEFAGDYRQDAQLQRAILEALLALGLKPREIPEYASIAEKHFGSENQAGR
jgi:hypothetical protein